MPRNPPWERDELILALDLYFRLGAVGSSHPDVIELSRVLNRLPIHTERPDPPTFRNPNGVAMKLANFASLDPEYEGAGLQRIGRGDAEVWEEFEARREELAREAARIRAR